MIDSLNGFMPILVEISEGASREYELGPSTTIGRDPSNTIALSDPMVSPRHAEIVRTEGGTYQLVDLGSRRGTYVSGRKITSTLLRPGDEILIGIYRLKFTERAAAAAPAPDIGAGVPLVQQRIPVGEPQFPPASQLQNFEDLARDYERLRA